MQPGPCSDKEYGLFGIQGNYVSEGGDFVEKERCNEANCTCPKKECPRHGICCECIMNHRNNGSLVFCMREIAKK